MQLWNLGRRALAVATVKLCLALGAAFSISANEATAQVSYPPLVVGDDLGGLVDTRARFVRQLKQSGQRVEIRGNICYSACTLYLGASNVCISPATTFGFHGPSSYGLPLSPERFEHWSNVMAEFYREPLRSWFMSDARHLRIAMRRISGEQLIRMGYRSC
ncbi:hypothetical protein [Pseudoroseicyclus tamaricis]|uniref:Uncharacterized protein n=1 Tax=Pseudoroseicyclus tamaricis TaxID=2705421 RepID=A0A6B2K2J5_9RHOB|nr:hypothetical protein [Pseudoroseicyclus tamaricis]NDV02794.1 hypothetical protein [Pseudoroseicyclus tamaricis]